MRGDLLRQGAHGGLQQAFISFTERQDFLVSRLWEQKERFILQCLEVPCVKEDNAWSFFDPLGSSEAASTGPSYRLSRRGTGAGLAAGNWATSVGSCHRLSTDFSTSRLCKDYLKDLIGERVAWCYV